jgi:hypothetical protein
MLSLRFGQADENTGIITAQKFKEKARCCETLCAGYD